MDKGPELTLLWRSVIQRAQRYMKVCSASLAIREIQFKTRMWAGGKECGRWKTWKEKEQRSLPLRMCFFPKSRSCVDVGRLFTRVQVLPAFLPARSETVGCISPFSRTCLRHLIFHGSGTPRQKKMAQMKEQIKAPEKIQLSDEKIANLSDAQFKTLVIRMLTELVEFRRKLDEKNEGYAKRNKGKCTGNQ